VSIGTDAYGNAVYIFSPRHNGATSFRDGVLHLPRPHLDRSVTARLVELLHLRHNLFQSGQPCVKFLLDLGLRLSQLGVEDSSVRTCVHRQLDSQGIGESAMALVTLMKRAHREQRSDEHAVIRPQAPFVCLLERDGELLGWVLLRSSKSDSSEFESSVKAGYCFSRKFG
jgi:hypothetical protein